ncbi:MAG: ABC transporter permease subunit, partial [Acidimicrobiales bacterium]
MTDPAATPDRPGLHPRAIAGSLWPAAAVLAVQLVVYPVPLGVWLQGLVVGLLNAVVVLGIMLVYRANRVVNLAQASVGAFPTAVAVGLILLGAPGLVGTTAIAVPAGLTVALVAASILRVPVRRAVVAGLIAAAAMAALVQVAGRAGYVGGVVVGLVVAVLTGAGIDAVVVRRFRLSARLVLTVATIGLAQFFAVAALLVPRLWNRIQLTNGSQTAFGLPGGLRFAIGQTVFGGDEVLAVVASLVCIAVVAVALRRTDVGVAVRAIADRSDRASMLGVPVVRLECGVWVVAGLLAFVGTFLQAAILGVPTTAGVGLRVLVAALAALALGGFATLPSTLAAAIAVGVLAQASGPASGHTITTTDTVLAVVVVVGLVLRRASGRRAEREAVSSWQASVEPRAVPPELARLAVVRAARWIGTAVVLAAAVALPLVLSPSQEFRAATVASLAVLALSVVVLTGWTGQVTLGQGAFAATGAVVTAIATAQWHFDLTLSLVLAGLAAALVAVVVGLPSLRWQGIFLAVSTLAVSLAATGYALNPTESTWIPSGSVFRRPLLGVWDLHGDTAMYETALAVLVLSLVAVSGIRRSRVGRVLRAIRDNGAGAQAFGVRVPVLRLVAFALSGFLAGVAGALLVYVNEVYDPSVFSADQSLNVFISSVVGGVGSAFGAVLGAGVLDGSRTFLSG